MTVSERTTVAAQRRTELLGAAARLMEREGAHAVSMQAVAEEAGVSVGLIYRYFGGKEDLVLAVIVDVLESFAARVPAAVEAAGSDPVRGLAAAFRAFCEVIDEHRHATVLTYRETKSLGQPGKARLKELELETSAPLRGLVSAGIASGVFREVDADLVAYNLLLAAHGWALKHWYFERGTTFEHYVSEQTSLLLHGLLAPQRRRRYADLLTTP